uniref:FAM212 domain-containing protein n=1 Tax=Electrophorus electricus TaxID=8005 RepID=A0A4W4DX37_ELEEL
MEKYITLCNLISMREAGDGLQAQMNSMMGVLHELKLLQVQTALEQLQISCKPGHLFQHSLNEATVMGTLEVNHQGSLCTSVSFCSSDDVSFSSHDVQERAPLSDSHPALRSMCEEHQPAFQPATMAELQGLMDTLSREGPSIDSDFSHCDTDDSSDWTSSLMNHSRNRQPLVLGDNVLADLVGNWLNLPEVEVSGSPLHLSCSGEFCRRLSLTASVFKRVLRSVRPNWDKLLKERPGWQGTEQEKKEIFKRPQTKNKGSKPKRSFYRPFWMRADGLRGKRRPKPANVELRGAKGPIFDYSFAIWV